MRNATAPVRQRKICGGRMYGVVIQRTVSKFGPGGGLQDVLLSTAQFLRKKRRGVLLSGAQFAGFGVGANHTFYRFGYCYRRHSLPGAGGQQAKILLLFSAQFAFLRRRGVVVIGGTILKLPPKFGLLFAAQFKKISLFAHVVICGTVYRAGVVIQRTVSNL